MSDTAAEARKMLRTDGAALYVGLSVSTLEKLRLTGDGPEYIKLGRTVVYSTTDLDAWMEGNRRKSTSVAA
ncbi:helix-turn-helix domain-containing protein [Mesorhizobium sp.]|uniref:helix-turn-helix transcriptional regulator n=1 Tax=Mesorhizobium sp. TaxID=1871066 RepID=UPI000FE53B34|nr:helix-turn-helix domain-containing protein [Mesorhizobium sp.]RWE99982.1 MAG: DNA-binding protein [Mesorhizobium sp.]